MLTLSYVSNETILYVDQNAIHWSIRLVQDVFDFTDLISHLSCLAENFPAYNEKVMIVSSDYRAQIAVNAFIRFCPPLDGRVFTANTLDEAYLSIKSLENQ
jgi:hypothetical protein